jgi:hypothetical protein
MGKRKRLSPPGRASFRPLLERREEAVLALRPRAPLAPTLPPDGGLSLPLPLGAGLLIETALTELGIQTRPLNLPLEPAKSPVEALVVLDDNFQTDHAPFRRICIKTSL